MKYVVSISFLSSTLLIRSNDTVSNQLKGWKHLQNRVRQTLNGYLLQSQSPILGGVLPILTQILPFKIHSQLQYKLVVVLSKEEIIPKISDFVSSSKQFKSLMSTFNCTEYKVTDETIKQIDDLGSQFIWTEVDKEQFNFVS